MSVVSRKSRVPLFVIDPLKADVAALTSVMSQEFAVRNHILAIEVHSDRILIGTRSAVFNGMAE